VSVVDGLRGGEDAAAFVPSRWKPTRDQTLSFFEGKLCRPSALSASRSSAAAALRDTYSRLQRYSYRLCRATAAESAERLCTARGAVVMTDALAKLARNDDQIPRARHEIGHVRQRHGCE